MKTGNQALLVDHMSEKCEKLKQSFLQTNLDMVTSEERRCTTKTN